MLAQPTIYPKLLVMSAYDQRIMDATIKHVLLNITTIDHVQIIIDQKPFIFPLPMIAIVTRKKNASCSISQCEPILTNVNQH